VATKWNAKGILIGACSCDWGCPCSFDAPPTQGKCEGGYVWNITEGRFGEVPLAGLSMSWLAHSSRSIAQGQCGALRSSMRKPTQAARGGSDHAVGRKAGGPWVILSVFRRISFERPSVSRLEVKPVGFRRYDFLPVNRWLTRAGMDNSILHSTIRTRLSRFCLYGNGANFGPGAPSYAAERKKSPRRRPPSLPTAWSEPPRCAALAFSSMSVKPGHIALVQCCGRMRQPGHGKTRQGNFTEAPFRDIPHIATFTFSLRGRSVETARTSPIAACMPRLGFPSHSI